MDAAKNIPAGSRRSPRRQIPFAGALLLFVLASILTAPNAGAAPEVASEVAAAASSVAEPATAPQSVPTPPPAPAPAPVAAPTPQPTPTAVPEAAATVVEQTAGSGSGASHAVRGSAGQSAGAVEAVAGGGDITHVPIVEETTRRANAVASSAANAAAEGTKTDGAPQQSPSASGMDDRTKGKAATGPVGRRGQIGPPSPQLADDALAWSWSASPPPSGAVHLFTSPKDASSLSFDAEILRATETSTSMPPDKPGRVAPTVPRNAAPPAPLVDASASSGLGAGFGSSILLLGLLALFALAAPRTPPRLLAAGARYRPDPFICALERPG
jgi:hypothetical protein